MKEVTLKNGATVPDVLVSTTMLALRRCMESSPLALYDLVMVCRREPGYVPFGDNGQQLRLLGLLESSGQPHGAVRDIVLSAITGDDADMALGSPLAEVTA